MKLKAGNEIKSKCLLPDFMENDEIERATSFSSSSS